MSVNEWMNSGCGMGSRRSFSDGGCKSGFFLEIGS